MGLNFNSMKFSVNLLRVPTVLEQESATDDGQGGTVQTWQAQTPVIFVNDDVKHAEYTGQGEQMYVLAMHVVTTRYIAALQGGGRWRFNGEFGIWYIRTVIDPKNDKHWQVCVCDEFVR